MSSFTVTGPSVDRRAASAALGLSAAITFASTSSRSGIDGSFYVRNEDGELVGRADADGSGSVTIYGSELLRRYKQHGQLPPEIEPTERRRPPLAAADADGRPGIPLATEPKEDGDMPTKAKSKPASGARKVIDEARESVDATKAPAAGAEKKNAAAAPAQQQEAKALTAKQATVAVLKSANAPMPVADITEKVLRRRGVRLAGKTPKATIAAMLSIESNKPDGLFVKVDRGMYKLREQAAEATA